MTFSISQLFFLTCFLVSSYVSLLLYIYNLCIKRIRKLEVEQRTCPVNKIYTILEVLKNDVKWIKENYETRQ